MIGFRSIAYPLFGLLLLVLPILLVMASVLMTVSFLRGGSRQRRTGFYYVFSAAGFALLDALLLRALPKLGLSFGPVWFSLTFLWIVRAVMYVLWAGGQVQVGRKNSSRNLLYPFWGINALFTLLVVYGFYIEPFRLQATRVEVPVPVEKLDGPVRIVQLSDLHVERTTMREKALIPLINSLQPDLVVLTGDYLNLSYLNDPIAVRDARELIGQLSAPYGVFAVSGSVDGGKRMQMLFSDTSVTTLHDTVAQVNLPVGSLSIIGVSDWEVTHDAEMVRTLTASVQDGQYRLLLFHTPDQIRTAADSGVDLYLAGHTHGGQIRLPFYGALVTFSIYGKKYEAGRYQVGDTTLYVSRGIGMEGGFAPRARFLTPPEVVVIDLVPDLSAKAP